MVATLFVFSLSVQRRAAQRHQSGDLIFLRNVLHTFASPCHGMVVLVNQNGAPLNPKDKDYCYYFIGLLSPLPLIKLWIHSTCIQRPIIH